MGSEIVIISLPLNNTYQFITAVVPVQSIITFNYQDDVLFCIVVLKIIMSGPICCIGVLSYCILYPDFPESYNHIILMFLHNFILSNIQSFMFLYIPMIFFYISPGYVYTVLPTYSIIPGSCVLCMH